MRGKYSGLALTRARMNHNVNIAMRRPYRSLRKCMVVIAMIWPTDWMALQEETVVPIAFSML